MTRLPAALSPWAESLAQLSERTQQAVGPWLRVLEQLVGPISSPDAAGSGPPDGLDGLGRRGPYERLAVSEWALWEVEPDEFVRRAASGEHLFHQLARCRPAGSATLTVLFDAGPEQLGAARLLHVAWFLLLARRAEQASRAFAWGALQDAPRLRSDSGATGVSALVGARSFTPSTEVDLVPWRQQLGEQQPNDERWLVGGPSSRSLAKTLGAGFILVEHEGAASAPSLRCVVERPTGRRYAILPLPAPAIGASVLRSPAVALSEAPRRSTGGAWIPGCGYLVMGHDEHVTFWSTQRQRTFEPTPGDRVRAASLHNGRPFVLVQRGEQLHLVAPRTRSKRALDLRLVPASGHPMPDVHGPGVAAFYVAPCGNRLWLTDSAGRVFHLQADHFTTEPLGRDIDGAAYCRAYPLSAAGFTVSGARKGGDRVVALVEVAHDAPTSYRLSYYGATTEQRLSGSPVVEVPQGLGGFFARPPITAVRLDDGAWSLSNHGPPGETQPARAPVARIAVPGSTRVLDLGRWPTLLTTPDNYVVERRNPAGFERLFTLSHPILRAATSPSGEAIALETAEGVWVFSPNGRVLRDPTAPRQ